MNNPIVALIEYINQIRRDYEDNKDMRSTLDEFRRVYEEALPYYNPFYPSDKIGRSFLTRLTYDGTQFFAENGLRIHIAGCWDSDNRVAVSCIGCQLHPYGDGFMYHRGKEMGAYKEAINAFMWIIAMIQPDAEYDIPYKEAATRWVFADADPCTIFELSKKYSDIK